jgi:hypothetical protein
VTGEPTYKATLKTIAFDGPKMTAKYDFPPDESLEVVLAATFERTTTKDTWSVIEKSSGHRARQRDLERREEMICVGQPPARTRSTALSGFVLCNSIETAC